MGATSQEKGEKGTDAQEENHSGKSDKNQSESAGQQQEQQQQEQGGNENTNISGKNEKKAGNEISDKDHVYDDDYPNPVLAGYFCKVVSLLLLHFPERLGNFLKGRVQPLLKAFFRCMHCRSITELFTRMLTTE